MVRGRVLAKMTRREIRQSLGRYLAIVAIIALGSGFFTGLKVTTSDMLLTGDVYTRRTALFDFRLLSTLGYDADSVASLGQAPGVRAAEGMITADFAAKIGEKDAVLKALSLTSRVNVPEVTEGRLPGSPSECLADAYNLSGLSLGEKVRVTDDNDTDTLELFREKEFTIVGFARSPLYINFERGTTKVGSGSLSAFILVPEAAFDTEVYTELCLSLDQTGPVYSDAYESAVDQAEPGITAAAEAAADARYHKLLSDGRDELLDGMKEYTEGVQDYRDGLREYADGLQEYADGLQEYADGKEELKQQTVAGRKKLDAAKTKLDSGEKTLKTQKKQLQDAKAQLEAQKTQLEQALEYARAQRSAIESNSDLSEEERAAALARADATISGYAQGLEQIRTNLTAVETGLDQVAAGEKELKDGRSQLKRAEYLYLTAIQDAEQELKDAEQELADAEIELKDAETELRDAEADLLEARDELRCGKQALRSLKAPDVYVLDRETNVGYACFDSDAHIVDGIAKVFPFFFLAVAALVCITTTGRMVEEQRGQIGVMKALGYSEATVMGRYLFYTGSASFIGILIGVIGGSLIFPPIIWQAYNIMYSMPAIELQFDLKLMLLTGGGYLLLALLTTYFNLRRELNEPAAELLRLKSPPPGKRILLERIGFIWKRLKFLHKVSLRNVFRYRKRLIMMVLGIGGCTALLLTGFGLNDSITRLGDRQYLEISLYDAAVTFSEDMSGHETSFKRDFASDVPRAAFLYSASANCESPETSGSVTLCGVEDFGELDGLMDFHTQKRAAVPAPGPGECIVSRNLAEKFGVTAGDTLSFTVDDTDTVTLRISGVFENIIYHYAYARLDSLRPYLTETELKTGYFGFNKGADVHAVGAKLSARSEVAALSLSADMRARVANMLDSMKYVVALVIVCAGALSFIVLFNLTNINIQERIREIATIKVLGFYAGETAQYVFRENLLLTFCGCAAGIPMGIALHTYVMDQVKIDMMAFDAVRSWQSYALAALATFVFTLVVDGCMRPRLDRVKMAESLKSME